MGLELTELYIAVEERYGLEFADVEADQVSTVGDLVQACRAHILWSQIRPCPSVACAFRLRRIVRDIAGGRSVRVRPKAAIAGVLSPAERREFWKRLPELFRGHGVPSLRRPPLVRWGLYAGWVIAIAGFVTVDFGGWGRTFLFALALAILLNLATRSFRTEPRESTVTFGALIGMIVKARGAESPPASANPELIFAEVRQIIAEIMEMCPEDIAWNHRLVQDLGMG